MATTAIGTASFTLGGAETASFTWTLVDLVTTVVFGSTPVIISGPSQNVSGGSGAGVPYFNGAGSVTATGGTLTCANPPSMTVTVTAQG